LNSIDEFTMKDSKIYLIGAFPPPVHGMSIVNDAIRGKIISLGIQPIVIDLSDSSLNRLLYSRLFRIRKILRGLIKFIKTMVFDGGETLYLSISGGAGQIYELPFICIGRLYGKHIFVHHHSYAYLHKKNHITRLLTLFAGHKATHIVACEDMARRLKALYSTVLNIVILSGIITVDRCISSDQSAKESLKTIGFISNISIEKGILDFLNVVSCLEKDDVEINALIAGPFQDKKIEALVMNRMSKLKTVEYVGPKFGEERSAFYKNIDVLLFPTNYVNESEGLVIHEAMAHRVPVIANARGCIESIIQSNSGLAIKCNEDFVEYTVKRLLFWQMSPREFQQASLSALQRFSLYRTNEAKKLEKLCSKIVSG
jgi:glycosyltransferase involved in cell wall biosynthesis